MDILKRFWKRVRMEIEIAGVWAGVGETVASLTDEQREVIERGCEEQEGRIRARYAEKA